MNITPKLYESPRSGKNFGNFGLKQANFGKKMAICFKITSYFFVEC